MQHSAYDQIAPTDDMAAEDVDHKYEPLNNENTIRVLDLRSGSDDGHLRGELRHVSLSFSKVHQTVDRCLPAECPHYEALSYVWGEAAFSRSMYCTTGKIALTLNLEAALKAMRYHDRDRIIWVDAICIDQSNVSERGHQVRLMGQIYANADRVLVWLGPDPENIARQTFRAIRSLARRTIEASDAYELERVIRKVTSLEWFHRLWVVQELVLSQQASVIWGQEQIDFSWIQFILLQSQAALVMDFKWVAFKNQFYQFDFLDALDWFRPLRCADDRDRVYAILGLPYGRGRALTVKMGEIEPDYTKSATQLFYEIACLCIECGQVATLLSQVYHGPEPSQAADRQLPSWVPDWACPIQYHAPRQKLHKKVTQWLRAHPIVDPLLRSLTLAGVHVDFVDCTTKEPLDSIPSLASIRQVADFWQANVFPLLDVLEHSDYAEYEKSFLRTLAVDSSEYVEWEPFGAALFNRTRPETMLEWQTVPCAQQMVQSLQRSMSLFTNDEHDEDDYDHVDDDEIDTTYGVHRFWAGGKIFKTTSGFLGLGPATIRSGDCIVALAGVNNPAVLRPDRDAYRFVGNAYVPDIRHHHALSNLHDRELRVRSFAMR
jgi:hypothetical protein